MSFQSTKIAFLIALLTFIILNSITAAADERKSEYLRPCYFTNWAGYRSGRARFVPEDYVPGLCTHIFYAFASFNASYIPIPSDAADLPNDLDPVGLYARINALKKYDPDLKTVLSFGGWTFSQTTTLFNNMTQSNASRAIFINSSIAFLRQHGFDGIDFDWEYPDSKENFNALLREYSEAAIAESKSKKKSRLLVVAAVAAGINTANASYDATIMAKYVDFVNLMTYDFHGTWESVTGFNSPLFSNDTLNIESAANFWVSQGMPKSKIVIGIPTYGHGWTLSNPENGTGVGASASGPADPTPFIQTSGTGAYFEFCEMLANSSTLAHFNKSSQVPFLVTSGNQWFSYEDVRSVKAKVKWIRKNQFGGAFVWTLDFDDFNGECPNGKGQLYPLIGTIAKDLGGVKLPRETVAQLMQSKSSSSSSSDSSSSSSSSSSEEEDEKEDKK